MTKTEFANSMAFLSAGVGKSLGAEQIAAWYELLGDLSVDELRRGIIETLRTHQFGGIPAVGVIRKNALGGVQTANLESNDRSLLAWNCVLDAIRTHGGYQTVKFDDPVIPAALRSIAQSWTALCETESEQLHTWKKKDFCQAYQSILASRQVTESAAAALPGILAEDARMHGYTDPQAVRIETNLPAPSVKVLESKPIPVVHRIVEKIATASFSIPKPVADEMPEHESNEDFKLRKAAEIRKLTEHFAVAE